MQTLMLAAVALLSYWTVHIDHPKDRAAYEELDRRFDATIHDFYVANHIDAPVALRITTDDGRYFGMRPRATLSDIEKPSALGPDLSKQLQAMTAPISAETHKVLRDHHNEIWKIERTLTTATEIAPRKYSMLRTDYVAPPKDTQYNAAMQQLVRELKGVDVIAFFSVYGDGAYRYLFLSDAPIKVRRLKGLAETHDSAARPSP